MAKVLGHRGCTSMFQRKEKQGDSKKKENRKDKLHERRMSAKRAHIRTQRLHKHDAKKKKAKKPVKHIFGTFGLPERPSKGRFSGRAPREARGIHVRKGTCSRREAPRQQFVCYSSTL